jgi:macrolide transport system ATP-binding/permease protein
MALIKLENVTKTYHLGEIDVPVLKGVSFSVEPGEMIALMGASGSGKSTLMNILGCLDRPTSGKYWLDGQDVSGLSPNERALVRTSKLGFVFQSFNLLTRTTALQNVLMPLDYSPTAPPASQALARAHQLIDRVGLGERVDHVPSQMSGGQQQRVAIARALINKPALLLADEPTGNLDSHTSVEILEMFQQLNAAGITVILVTHDPNVAMYAHRTIRVVDGLVVDDASSKTVLAHAGIDPIEAAPGANGLGPHAGSNGSNGRGNDHGDSAGGMAIGGATTLAPSKMRKALHRTVAPVAATEPRAAADKAPAPTWASTLLPAPCRTALSALRRNKMRSALTTLGIIIGVAAVISMIEIGQGSRTSLMDSIASMGANTIMIRSGAAASGGISFGAGSVLTLTPEDAEEIGRSAPAVDAVAPVVQIQGTQVIRGNKNWIPMTLQGITPSYLRIRDWENLYEGEMFTDSDVRNATRVCVVGQTIVRELFDGQSPIGEDLRVKNVTLRVVGVLSRKGANMMGMDQDDCLYAPWTTIKYRIADNSAAKTAAQTAANPATEVNSLSDLYAPPTQLYPQQSPTQAANTPQPVRFLNVDQIMLKAASTAAIPEAIAQVTTILRDRHRLREGAPSDFNIRDMSEMIATMGATSQMMGTLLLIVAMISLAVGGVGIMNIMLVSVTERTREIGLRMAVGARGHHILRQFLIEAIVLCLLGGLVGILLGRGASLLVWYFLRWPIQASMPAIIAAFLVSASIGVAFGFYPAWKAARLDPIEALRYE